MIGSLDFLQSVENLIIVFSIYLNEKYWQQMNAPYWVFFYNYNTVSKFLLIQFGARAKPYS